MIDPGWSRTATAAAYVIFGATIMVELAVIAPVMVPWLIAIAAVAIVVETMLGILDANLPRSSIAAAPRVSLSAVLWLTAAATPRPSHALFCVGAILVFRILPSRATRAGSAAIVIGLIAMAWVAPSVVFSSWAPMSLPATETLYRVACAVAALPFQVFLLERRWP